MSEISADEEQILLLHAEGKWRQILQNFDKNKFLPWIWPNEDNLYFIGEHVRRQDSNTLVSIGCGSGLLEWLLTVATGIDVIGIEIKGVSWATKYSPGSFIPLFLIDDTNAGLFDFDTTRSVLLFCYFNNLNAFMNYLNNFKGKCFIADANKLVNGLDTNDPDNTEPERKETFFLPLSVIGPGEGRGTYSVPEPFLLPENVGDDWKLIDHQKMHSSEDYIAVYIRKLKIEHK